MNTKDLERFLKKVVMLNGIGGCWTWRGAKYPNGRGAFKIDGRTQQAHRISYEHYKGKLINNCLHTCDNVECVNPDHLKDGTQQDNAFDAMLKNNQRYGKKLTDDDVKTIKALREEGQTNSQIASKFGVGTSTIQRVIKGKVYGYV